MILTALKPKKALNKAFLKVKPTRAEIERFKTNLISLLDRTNDTESEEFHKNLVSDFLKDTYYKQHHFINTKGRNDLVIHNGPQANTPVGVIIEAKKPTNKAEMMTEHKLNVKAFHELVLYYLRERITLKNLSLKHLVATNINEWFIFDASLFDRLFAQNRQFVKQFRDFEEGRLTDSKTEFFYKHIAEPFIADITTEIQFAYFNIQDFQKPLRNANPSDDHTLIALFKLLSPEHLLKLPFTNDSNSLDKRFYSELLHIIGLTEAKEGGKKLIQRNKPNDRHSGTLLEDTIVQLDSLDKLSRLNKPNQFGNTQEERLFHVALELSITWVNRILFLKLLEAQLISYHKNEKRATSSEYSFLTLDKIKNYADLNSLFFQVLARQPEERTQDVRDVFSHVPYLNSSLFEPTELEQITLFISNLRGDKAIPIISTTVLKDTQGKKRTGNLTTLEYLFAFLDAYDFSSEGSEDIQEGNKTLINASVLGLIFEKINGYKDGSFFTPGFITMYMCRETIRKAVIQKFSHTFPEYGIQQIIDIYNLIPQKIPRKKANELVNSLKICDPAVGSGHFLVSALNEIMAVKNELKILEDKEGKSLLRYEVEVVNDELIVTDENGELFEYNPLNKESQRIQETLFHEKQTLIEKCLFGVDINTNSVKICRLRLWIELLKNAYYKIDSATPNVNQGLSNRQLETLPNIDINIKCGNSLVSRFALDADLSQALKKRNGTTSRWTMDSYRVAVDVYRNAENKEQKREMERLMADIKNDFRSEIAKNDPKLAKLRKLSGELYLLTNQQSLFEMNKKEKADWNKKVAQLSQETQNLELEIDEIKSNKIYEHAFEWRFEFPEVLNDAGDFIGFDAVIGNPPYIRQEEFAEIKPYLLQAYPKTGVGTADMFVYFVELALNLLKNEGEFAFIIPNKWMRAGYGRKLREFVAAHQIHQLIDFGDLPVFEEATTYPNVIQLKKSLPTPEFHACHVSTLEFDHGLKHYVDKNQVTIRMEDLSPEGWSLSDKKIQALLSKIKRKGKPLGEYVEGKIFRGVLTGLNEAFVLDKETKERLISEDARSAEVIKPFLGGRDIKRYQTPEIDKYLILFPKGFTIKRNLSPGETNFMVSEPPPRYGNMEYTEAWAWLNKTYPAIAAYLLPFKSQAEKRTDQGDFWWELRACDYYQEFEKEKIMLPDISKKAEAIIETSKSFCVNTAYIIPKNDKYLLGILNSKIIHYYYAGLTSSIRGGYLRFIRQYMGQIPIVEGELRSKKMIEDLVIQIIERKKQSPSADTGDLEAQIDRLVYALYELTEEEIGLVEGG